MESAFAASSFGASGSRIGTTRTPVSGPGVRKSEDKTEETGGSIYEQLYASGVRSMGDAYFMGGSAAANQAKNVIERGGSNAQALWSGLAAGAAEAFFEKFSVDQLLKPKTVNNWKSLLTETAKQAGVEASEEMFTEVANILSDAAIMGDSSDFSTSVAGYMAQGMSEEKAKQKAFLDCIGQVVWAGAGGALSGGMLGGTVGALNYAGGRASSEQNAPAAQEPPASPRTAPDAEAGTDTVNVPQRGAEAGESGFSAPSAIRDTDLTSAFGENGAKAYRLGWRGDMNEADYYRAFTHAYNAGAAGRSLDSLKDRTLTDAQRGAAFESGRSDADAAARKAGFTTVYGKDSGLVWDDYTRSMDQKVAGQVNEVAKHLGVKVQFADRVAGGAANAKIENGVITIARDAKNPVRAVFGHEITHRIQELAPEEYRAFREAAMAHYENAEDGMVDALVWDQQSRYTKVDQDLSNLDAMDEIAADYAGSLMEDGALLDRFIQANQGKRTLLGKLRDVFRNLADRLTGKYKGQARQAERRLERALKAAARQAASLQGKAHGATMSETKLSLKNMNEDETAALLQYKSSDSYKVNAKLRDGQRLTEAEQKMVDDLDRALEKLPVHEGTVYRRLSFDMEGQEALDAFLAEHAEGDIVPYEAYTSGSTTQDGYPVQGELTVTQIISSQTGRDMAGIGNNFESEVVFPRGCDFVVERVTQDAQGKPVIYMKEDAENGIGQLHPEKRVQAVQQMQKEGGRNNNLHEVPGTDTAQSIGWRELPGVRGEGNEEVKFSLKGSDQLTREIDRLMKQVQDGTRSEAEVRREIRGLVDEVYQGMVEQYGSIKPGEKPAREVRVPRRTADDRKVSQTVRTILEAKVTPDAAVPNIEELTATGAFSYETYTDKAAIADAESTIRDKGYATALAEWSESVGKGEVSKANTATGWALYNAAANAGDLKSAMTVLTKMVGHQRNAAQAVQATRILKSMSPEGQLYGVQRSVGNLQEELKKKYGKNAPDLKIDPNLAENLLKAENQEARDEAAKELFRDIGRQMPSRFMDKWNAWRYLAMLGNPRTHVRNIVGNAFFAPVVAAKSLTATSIEAAVSRVSHGKLERTKGAVGLGKADRALLSSAWADYANVQDSALGGGKYSDFANANQYIEEGRRIFKNKALETFRKGNTKALDAEDVWFSRPHYAYALAQYCKANHITAEQIAAGKGMDKARAYAIKEAQKATYRDTNALSQAISDLGRYRGKGPVGKGISTVMEGVLPFRKTPANILARGLEYSPAGLLKGLTYDLYQVREGNLSGAEAIDHISAGMTGTGLLAFGAYCAAQCLVRGAGGDDKDRKAFAELQGHQNYALELPDGTSITLDWLAPEVLPFFIGVNLWEMTQGEKEPLTLSAILRASANVTEPLLEMSCLQSLNDVFDTVGYASSGDLNGLTAALVTAATSYLTQGVPTVLGQFERTGQEERMTTYTEKNAFLTPDAQYTLGRISGRIPGWDYNQIPYIDAWGRTENTGGAGKRAFDNFANPAYTSEVKSSPMEDELLRLYETTGEKGVFPARAGKYFTVNGERKDLTAEEYVTYATKRGQLSHTLVTELTGSKSYQSMTDEQLVYLIVNARQK
ncbi:ADP-ribosyltransferase [Intestinimonas massiliensis]|uniref:ADP-ribosyltransferase n=1 Tax=Intestinimonas massiliensis (ex Afouda et al. 2020) TaxID=1673721 RepID=A0AAW5JPN8_9FIRM|nr:ADP-ribosyltransferase [Intestinimonas massiliensis (ex Afouda et al. 2020)]MCQ4770820.1 ADP-ribosyltransferase [Intestinimonas massiliensis (ex Afouda et al. 2020)]